MNFHILGIDISKAKFDKADAKLIARLCKAISPKPWQPTPDTDNIKQLQSLVRCLDALIYMHR